MALLCGEIYGGARPATAGRCERAHDAAPGLAGVTLNYAYFLEQRDDRSARPACCSGAPRPRRTAAPRCGGHSGHGRVALPAARAAGQGRAGAVRLLRRLEDLAVDLEQRTSGDARSLVGNMPVRGPIGLRSTPREAGKIARRGGVQPAGVAPSVPRNRGRSRVAVVAEFGGNTSPGLLFVNVFKACGRNMRSLGAGYRRAEGLETDFTLAAIDAAALWFTSRPTTWSRRPTSSSRPSRRLVYLALVSPSDLRAGAALARVVLVFGHGHPLTSGLDTVDYFVS